MHKPCKANKKIRIIASRVTVNWNVLGRVHAAVSVGRSSANDGRSLVVSCNFAAVFRTDLVKSKFYVDYYSGETSKGQQNRGRRREMQRRTPSHKQGESNIAYFTNYLFSTCEGRKTHAAHYSRSYYDPCVNFYITLMTWLTWQNDYIRGIGTPTNLYVLHFVETMHLLDT